MPQLDWTGILGTAGLEAPGYHEARQAANQATIVKRLAVEQAKQEKKAARSRGKKTC